MLRSFDQDVDELVLVGSGHHRHVYVHPYDKFKCIKVIYDERARKCLKSYRCETAREGAYYNFLTKREISYSHIAKYHGTISVKYRNRTQLANVFDLIRDNNGEISKTLDVELSRGEVNTAIIAGALHELYVYLLRYKIISGFKMKNILVQYIHEMPKCVMVDNIGNSDFIPVCNYVDWFATIKIERRWRNFLKKMLVKNPSNTVIKETLRMACR